ncbi:hypothetical protein TNCT_565181 [Trichonephila clavata]|uniref:Uncharacterized protein n=1 Tax=Trichonephila clavata TaxID=2740835 RepID=A0A8X6LHY3_TRICU|nr:hypothetical protein TNCT_565181 [Trichonephila clavata]
MVCCCTHVKSYEHDADTSVEEGLAKLAFNALNIKRNSPNNVEKLRYENSREGSGNPESFSAVTTKFGEFNELSVFSNHSESDNISSENQASKFENPNVVQKSSKRSLRRKRLREMCV